MSDNNAEQMMEQGEANASPDKQQKGFWTKPKLAVLLLVLLAGVGTALGVTLSQTGSSDSSKSSTNSSSSSSNAQEDGAVTSPPASETTTSNGDDDSGSKLNTFKEGLPTYTQTSLEDPGSPQARALAWLSTHRDLAAMEDWRMKQLMALSTFFFAFNGDEWKKIISQDWLSDTMSECDWITGDFDFLPLGGAGSQVGETFNMDIESTCNDDGRVERLSLSHLEIHSLNATMPAEISFLTDLEAIDIRNGNITGRMQDLIPAQLGDLSKLTTLDFASNFIVGTLPETTIGLLTNLKTLQLTKNRVAGSIPTTLGLLTNLEKISLADNALQGSIPGLELGQLSNLEELHLSDNQLSSSIPTELSQLSNLQELHLDGCFFWGR